MPPALSGLRILDFSRVLAGPFATMVLGDLGAEVTKVERPGQGDETRGWGPPFDAAGEATYFQSVNRNKTSVALDLRDADDLATARDLSVQADVIVENFRPGLLDNLGLGYDELSAENPGVVYCSITGFGAGAGASLPGYDLLIQALGGLMSITGDPDGEPTKVGVAMVDVLAGLYAVIGILAAVHDRLSSGRGQKVEVNLLSALLASLVNQGAAYTQAGVVPGRMGNRHPSVAPYEPIRTGSGELVLAVGNDRQFQALCETIGAPELAADPRYRTNSSRVDNASQLRADLERLLAPRSASEWAYELNLHRVPAGVVNDIAAAFTLAERLELEPTIELAGSDGRPIRLTRNPIGLSRTPPQYKLPPPALGS